MPRLARRLFTLFSAVPLVWLVAPTGCRQRVADTREVFDHRENMTEGDLHKLLEESDDFPKEGPILVITDAQCDRVRLRREHAFLTPKGARLPFVPRGPVFRME